MKSNQLFNSKIDRLSRTLKRFPLALACSSLTTILLIYFLNLENQLEPAAEAVLARAVLVSALGINTSASNDVSGNCN